MPCWHVPQTLQKHMFGNPKFGNVNKTLEILRNTHEIHGNTYKYTKYMDSGFLPGRPLGA